MRKSIHIEHDTSTKEIAPGLPLHQVHSLEMKRTEQMQFDRKPQDTQTGLNRAHPWNGLVTQYDKKLNTPHVTQRAQKNNIFQQHIRAEVADAREYWNPTIVRGIYDFIVFEVYWTHCYSSFLLASKRACFQLWNTILHLTLRLSIIYLRVDIFPLYILILFDVVQEFDSLFTDACRYFIVPNCPDRFRFDMRTNFIPRFHQTISSDSVHSMLCLFRWY